MRALKWVASVAAGVILVLAALMLAVTLFVNPNRFKGRIESTVHEATGRPLKLEGDLGIAWYPWLAVQTGPAQLGNPAGMAGEPLVQWKSLSVGAKLIPLLRGELVMGGFALDGLRVHLRRTRDGRANWEEWLNGGGSKISLERIERIEIRDATLDYTDERDGTHITTSFELAAPKIRVGDDGAIAVKPIELRLDETRFSGELTRTKEVWDFALHGDRIALDRYVKSGGGSGGDKPFELPTDTLKSLRVRGLLSLDEVEIAGAKMKDVRLRLEDGKLHEP